MCAHTCTYMCTYIHVYIQQHTTHCCVVCVVSYLLCGALDTREHLSPVGHVPVTAGGLPVDISRHLCQPVKCGPCVFILKIALENELLITNQVRVHRTTACDERVTRGDSTQGFGCARVAHDGLDVVLDGLRGVLHDVPLSVWLAYKTIMPLNRGFVLRQYGCVYCLHKGFTIAKLDNGIPFVSSVLCETRHL